MVLINVIRGLGLTVVVLGLVVVYLAWKGYNRLHSGALLFLGFGFALMTVGSVIEGILFEFFSLSIEQVHAIELIFEVAGFAMVVYSIYST